MLSTISPILDLTVKLLWGSVHLVTGIVYVSIELSCLIGYVIVRNGVTVINTLFHILTGFFKFIHVLIEDYTIFVSDVCSALSFIFNFVLQCAESFYNSVVYCVYFLCFCVCAVGSFFLNILTSVFAVFHNLFSSLVSLYLLVKKTCLLVGLSVWNTVTGVPNFLVSILCLWKQKIYEGCTFLLNCVQSGLLSIFEFPLKPVCGLSIAILLGIVILKKRYSLWHIAYRTWLISTTRSQQLVLLGWQTFEGYVLWLLTNQTRDRLIEHFGDRPTENNDGSSSDDSEDENGHDDNNHYTNHAILRNRKPSRSQENSNEEMDVRMCVVCQDKTRCIVTLPCRHVCLCNTCCTAVRKQQGLCPLCRQEITYAGRVYL